MQIGVETTNYSHLGTYTIKVVIWDGGDGNFSTASNVETSTPSFTLNVLDSRACTSSTLRASVNLSEDTENGGWDYVYTIG